MSQIIETHTAYESGKNGIFRSSANEASQQSVLGITRLMKCKREGVPRNAVGRPRQSPTYPATASANCFVSVYCWNLTALPSRMLQMCANCARTVRAVPLWVPL